MGPSFLSAPDQPRVGTSTLILGGILIEFFGQLNRQTGRLFDIQADGGTKIIEKDFTIVVFFREYCCA